MFGVKREGSRGTRAGDGGFQMAELLVASMVFLLLSGLCFYAASAGFRLFAQTTSRQVLQRDARALFAWLQRDAELTNLVLCSVDRQTSVEGYPRTRLGMPTLNSWSEPITVDDNGVPRWDRVVCYTVTEQLGRPGILFRQVKGPQGEPLPLTADGVRAVLGSFDQPQDQRRLSGSIRSFEVDISLARDLLVFDVVLEDETVSGGTGQTRSEILEFQTVLRPQNTWPRL